MIYYFPDGINNERMQFIKAMSHEGITIAAMARFIDFFETLDIKPHEVSVWLQEENSDIARYFLGNPGIIPSDDNDTSVDLAFIVKIGDLDFIVCTLDEDIGNLLAAGIMCYGEYIFGVTFNENDSDENQYE